MDKVSPCLWFNGDAEEAASFYVSLLPDSRIDRVVRSPSDYPAGKEGSVLMVEFTLAGRSFSGLNGGPEFGFTEAVSMSVACENQAEVDRLWDALSHGSPQVGPCGWIKDRWGLSWQIVPKRMLEILGGEDRDGARRAMQAMVEMNKLDLPAIEAAFAGG